MEKSSTSLFKDQLNHASFNNQLICPRVIAMLVSAYMSPNSPDSLVGWSPLLVLPHVTKKSFFHIGDDPRDLIHFPSIVLLIHKGTINLRKYFGQCLTEILSHNFGIDSQNHIIGVSTEEPTLTVYCPFWHNDKPRRSKLWCTG